MAASQTTRSLVNAVDHLMLGSRDLDAGIAWVEKRTGVRAVVGGSHPGRGTRNALLAFERRRYLEIIAPDPAQPAGNLTMNLGALAEPRLIRWAASSSDLAALATSLRERGRQDSGPVDGARVRPDGSKLAWRTLALPTTFERDDVDPIPFFIQWSTGSQHPSRDSPRGCDVIAFEIEHPDADAVKEALAHAGIDATVRQAKSTRLVATLESPNGRVVLA